MWLVAFLAGFSDRFADSLLQSLVGRFGGEKNGELVAMQMGMRQPSGSVLDRLTVMNRGKGAPAPVATLNTDGIVKPAALTVIGKSDSGVPAMAQ